MWVLGGAFVSDDYAVDTDQLRLMASRTVQVAEDFGSARVALPTTLGHEAITDAVDFFAEKWGAGLQTRVDELGEFSDKLKTTARVFDEGQDASRAEMDSLIWDS